MVLSISLHPIPTPFMANSARHEAAYKLTGNAEAVARFACRGAGRGSGWSLLPGRAPLSDPNASPNMDILPDVDYCLRRVSFVGSIILYVRRLTIFQSESSALSRSSSLPPLHCANLGPPRHACFTYLCRSSGVFRSVEGLSRRRPSCAAERSYQQRGRPWNCCSTCIMFRLPSRQGKPQERKLR